MSDLKTAEAASLLNTTPETIRRLIESGDLRAYRLRGESGPWRIEQSQIEEYREKQRSRDPWARTRPRTTQTREARR